MYSTAQKHGLVNYTIGDNKTQTTVNLTTPLANSPDMNILNFVGVVDINVDITGIYKRKKKLFLCLQKCLLVAYTIYMVYNGAYKIPEISPVGTPNTNSGQDSPTQYRTAATRQPGDQNRYVRESGTTMDDGSISIETLAEIDRACGDRFRHRYADGSPVQPAARRQNMRDNRRPIVRSIRDRRSQRQPGRQFSKEIA